MKLLLYKGGQTYIFNVLHSAPLDKEFVGELNIPQGDKEAIMEAFALETRLCEDSTDSDILLRNLENFKFR